MNFSLSGLPILVRQRANGARNKEQKSLHTSDSGGPNTTSRDSFAPNSFLLVGGTRRRASSAQGHRRILSRRVPRKEFRRGSRARRNSSFRTQFIHPQVQLLSSEPEIELERDAICEDGKKHHPLRRISRILSNAGPAFARRVSQLRRKSVALPEFEDVELAPLRYRPIGIQQLSEITRFSKEELQFIYRGFKQECPTGVISEETFKSIYGKFFPLRGQPDDGSGRNTAMYAHYVFGTMDQDGTGHITFGDFIMGLSVLLKGSLQERVNWVFNLYDINNDGYITKEELIDIVTSVYDLLGDEANPNIEDVDITAVDHVDKLFEGLDINDDGVVTLDEFMEYCSKNEVIVTSLNIFDYI